jgi:muramidase (phage lysozyme)
MAKKPGKYIAILGNTKYYQTPDGRIVDENGALAPKQISTILAAQVSQPAAPVAPSPAMPPEEPQSTPDTAAKQESKSRLSRMFPSIYAIAEAVRKINRDSDQKKAAEEKRQSERRTRFYEVIEDKLDDVNERLTDVIAVQERTAGILSEIAEAISHAANGGNLGRKALAAGGLLATGAALTYFANRKKNDAEPTAAPPPPSNNTSTQFDVGAAIAAGGGDTSTLSAYNSVAPSPATGSSDTKETKSVKEARAKKNKTEDILKFKAQELRFNSDKLTFDVKTLTINQSGVQTNQAAPTTQRPPAANPTPNAPLPTVGDQAKAGRVSGNGAAPVGPSGVQAKDMSPQSKAFLDTLGASEGGKFGYQAINYAAGGGSFQGTRHPFEGQKGVTAAGRYQMLWSTWSNQAKKLGIDPKEFTPENQDRVAWSLAQDTYRARTKRDLAEDLKDPNKVASITSTLGPTWKALLGGRQDSGLASRLAAYSQTPQAEDVTKAKGLPTVGEQAAEGRVSTDQAAGKAPHAKKVDKTDVSEFEHMDSQAKPETPTSAAKDADYGLSDLHDWSKKPETGKQLPTAAVGPQGEQGYFGPTLNPNVAKMAGKSSVLAGYLSNIYNRPKPETAPERKASITYSYDKSNLLEHSSADARMKYGLEHSDLDTAYTSDPVKPNVSDFSHADFVEAPKKTPLPAFAANASVPGVGMPSPPKKPSPRAHQEAGSKPHPNRVDSNSPTTRDPGGQGGSFDQRIAIICPWLPMALVHGVLQAGASAGHMRRRRR